MKGEGGSHTELIGYCTTAVVTNPNTLNQARTLSFHIATGSLAQCRKSFDTTCAHTGPIGLPPETEGAGSHRWTWLCWCERSEGAGSEGAGSECERARTQGHTTRIPCRGGGG